MFFKKVSNFCKEHGTGILVVGGDFNEIMQDIDAIFISNLVNDLIIDCFINKYCYPPTSRCSYTTINVKICIGTSDDAVFSLVCIYAPNSKTLRNMFFKKVSNFCKKHGTGILVVGGDFNEIMQDHIFFFFYIATLILSNRKKT
jgi:uncharacterized protein (DUF1330 family)